MVKYNHTINSVSFNSSLSITSVPHGVDTGAEFAHIPVFPTAFNFSGTFAIQVWVKFSATASIRSRIIATNARTVGGVTNAFTLSLLGDETFFGTSNNALRVGMGVDPDGTQIVQATSEPVIKPDTWHHIVGQVISTSPSVINIYVDGCLRDTVAHKDLDYAATTNTGGTNPVGLVVGWDPRLSGPFKGNISSLVVFNRNLTETEVEWLSHGPCRPQGTVITILLTDIVAWWKMGDGDVTGLATLTDSAGTHNLTTVNMSASNLSTDFPEEKPKQHQRMQISKVCSGPDFRPNEIGCTFLWDSFASIDVATNFPLGWFGIVQADDAIQRVNEVGRLSVLRFSMSGNDTDVLYMTNVSTNAVGNTFLWGHAADPDTTEYCMEILVRTSSANADLHYFGFVNAPHSVGSGDPTTGVFARWNPSSGDLHLVVGDSDAPAATAVLGSTTLLVNTFYRIKICFGYIPNVTQTAGLRARMYVNDSLNATNIILSNSTSYPDVAKSGDLFIGTDDSSSAAYTLDIEWINVTYRGGGATGVLDL